MLPVTVNFTPTTEEWREALRAVRADVMINRLIVAFFAVLAYGVIRFFVSLVSPGDNAEWDLSICILILIGLVIARWPRRRRRVRFAMRRAAGAGAVAAADASKIAAPAGRVVFDPNLAQAFVISPASIEYRAGGTHSGIAWGRIRHSETKRLFVLYLTDSAFGFLPGWMRRWLPGFVLMSSRRIGVIPIPKRAFVCVPDENYVRELLYVHSREA